MVGKGGAGWCELIEKCAKLFSQSARHHNDREIICKLIRIITQ
jgi:hypothetical protein